MLEQIHCMANWLVEMDLFVEFSRSFFDCLSKNFSGHSVSNSLTTAFQILLPSSTNFAALSKTSLVKSMFVTHTFIYLLHTKKEADIYEFITRYFESPAPRWLAQLTRSKF